MKKLCILPALAAVALFAACQKQQTEEERNAEVERQVQQRLAAEKQADQQQTLALQQAELDARERALAAKESATSSTQTTARPTQTPRSARESSEPRTTASYGTFYRKLEPYGAWFETNDYGYVWQPQEAERSRSWRPYTDGHWVYTDAGWTWVSDEPFGWATYHYGRWVRLRNVGWAWVPGDEWAPAWVSWRTSDEYVGWAPLPPEARFDRHRGIHNWADNYYDIGPEQYAFVPANELGAQRLNRAVVPPERNVTIINQTTNVTNITYNNTTVVNQGPNYEQFRSRSSQPIERYRLERETTVTGDTARPVVRGEVIAMPAPMIGAAPGYDRPRSIKERITDAVVENGWAGIGDRSAADQARAKMKSEATPPPDAPPKTFVRPQPADAPAASISPTATAPMASASPETTPIARATATATPRPIATTTATATPTPTATARATATPERSATPVETASPSATRAFSPRPDRFRSPRPAASAAAVEESAVPTSSPAAAQSPSIGTGADIGFSARDAKARDQQQKRAFEEARKQRHSPQRNPLTAPSPLASPKSEAPAATTSTPAETTSPTPASATTNGAGSARGRRRIPPDPIVTPPPTQGTTDVTRQPSERKAGNARRAAAASNPAAAAQQDAAPAVSATPVSSVAATAPTGVSSSGPAAERKPKRHRELPAVAASPAEESATPTATPAG